MKGTKILKSEKQEYCSDETVLTVLSNPSVMSIKKNTSAHRVDQGMLAMASGYTSNTSPEPK